jgi:hypothetical protein
MAMSTGGDRSAAAASILVALIEAKTLFPSGETLEAKGEDMGKAFKALYRAIDQAEKGQ